jgi:hypothetical protein
MTEMARAAKTAAFMRVSCDWPIIAGANMEIYRRFNLARGFGLGHLGAIGENPACVD